MVNNDGSVCRLNDSATISKTKGDKKMKPIVNGSVQTDPATNHSAESSDSDEFEDAVEDLSVTSHSAKRRKLSGGCKAAITPDNSFSDSNELSPAVVRKKAGKR